MIHLLGQKVWQLQDKKAKSEKKTSWRSEIRTAYATSVCFRSGGIVKMPELVEKIPQSGVKNQIKLARGLSLYHKDPPLGDLSDGQPGGVHL
jgi:hypothetical protein